MWQTHFSGIKVFNVITVYSQSPEKTISSNIYHNVRLVKLFSANFHAFFKN